MVWKKLIFISGASNFQRLFWKIRFLNKRFVRSTSYFWQRFIDLYGQTITSLTARLWRSGPNWLTYHARSKLETGQSCSQCVPWKMSHCLFELRPLVMKAEKRMRCSASSEDFCRRCSNAGPRLWRSLATLARKTLLIACQKDAIFYKNSFVVQ